MGWENWVRVNARTTGLDVKNLNSEIEKMLGHKIKSLSRDGDLRKDIGYHYLNQVEPYVPMKTGKLRRSGSPRADGRVVWSAISKYSKDNFDYALYQFENEAKHYTTPGTQSNWTDKVKPGTPDYKEFIARITPEIQRRFRDG